MDNNKKTIKKGLMFKIGLALAALTVPLWLSPIYIPFTSYSTPQKLTIIAGCYVVAEIFFWVAAFLVGKEVVAKYKSW